MRIRINFSLLLGMAALLASVSSAKLAQAQSGAPADKQPRTELAIAYDFVRSNAPPDSCGCFNLNGGSATFAWPARPGHFALVADATVTHAGGISKSGYSLTMSTFTAGGRYLLPTGRSQLRPFVQGLIGVAHASGSLVEGDTPAASNSGAALAANIGGGLDLRVNRRFSLRMLDADYLLTRFDNGTNDHQNNLRLSAGVVFHF